MLEQAVLQLIADGATNKTIADKLGISVHGVKHHVANLLKQLGCSNRTEVASTAMRQGLVPTEAARLSMSFEADAERLANLGSTVLGVGISEAGAQESLTDLLRQPAFQEVASLFRQFIAAAGNGHGAPGIAKVLPQHTSKPVIVEDPTGQVVAASGVDRSRTSDVVPKRGLPGTRSRRCDLRQRPVGGRCMSTRRSPGAIILLDSGEQPTGVDFSSWNRPPRCSDGTYSMAATSPRPRFKLWGDFATELFEDSDSPRVRSHATRLGYDLDQPHRAVLVRPGAGRAPSYANGRPGSPQVSGSGASVLFAATGWRRYSPRS